MAISSSSCFSQTYWSYGTDMEIKNTNSCKYYVHMLSYPRQKYIPEIKRNGFTGNFYGWEPISFFSLILSNSKAETLLKTNQTELFKNYELKRIDKYWNQIKICIRNNYYIKNLSLFFDHIGLLEYFKRDLNYPKYICPDDFHTEHQRLIKKKRDIERKKRIAQLKIEMARDNEIFIKEKGKFFDLEITDGVIYIIPLKSVFEF